MAKVRVKQIPRNSSMQQQEVKRGFDAYDISTPDVYANNVETIIGASEISLVFGHNIEPSGLVAKPIVRVTLTHANFILIMKYLNKRVDLFDVLYSDRLITLDDIANTESDTVRKAFSKMFGEILPGDDE